jgi:hypothetical protein
MRRKNHHHHHHHHHHRYRHRQRYVYRPSKYLAYYGADGGSGGNGEGAAVARFDVESGQVYSETIVSAAALDPNRTLRQSWQQRQRQLLLQQQQQQQQRHYDRGGSWSSSNINVGASGPGSLHQCADEGGDDGRGEEGGGGGGGGPPALADMALRAVVRYADCLTAESLQGVPGAIGRLIWGELQR